MEIYDLYNQAMNIMVFGAFLAKNLTLGSASRGFIQSVKISKFRLLAWHFEPQCSNKSILRRKKCTPGFTLIKVYNNLF